MSIEDRDNNEGGNGEVLQEIWMTGFTKQRSGITP